jgi:hypothetical protein
MGFFKRLKPRLSTAVLRGSLRDAWVNRKMQALENRFCRTLVAHSKNPPAPDKPPALKTRRRLRKILFISDVQWELKELVPELRKICEVETLNLHPHLAKYQGQNNQSEIVVPVLDNFIRENTSLDPELIFFYARSSLLSEEVFASLRRKWPCPLIGMNLDDKIEFLDYNLFTFRNDNYLKWAKLFDLNLSNTRAAVDWYADHGLPVYYMPEGYHLKNPPPSKNQIYKHEISFVGSWRMERASLFEELQNLGVPIEPVGFGWPNSEAGNDPDSVYRASMMNLGIGFASPSRTLTTVKTRDFECPGAGCCYLTTFNWELAELYDVGKEILCYRSVEELVELFSYHRRRPEICAKIAEAAYRRCAGEHTWEKRFRDLFKESGVTL